ncbi:hypothetical protein BA895_12035 [Humibacillus sp. DSM 29435]|uniref:MarR family winged helix-turn-helix transcriptional regulator n=1 Tax=Humibacillus sp. DSM 29435 TaxID=1869167 RepID=UPI0008733F16|nr:MarR family transcriptional regulator [Humibacillus sp. DSM 29435]OFE18359.1 hypothetical protein BA895_12035 [Humibacillus sp. DSM 29435]
MTAPDLNDLIRSLRIELAILNDRIADQAGLKPRDLDLLDVIDRDGPCTPTHLRRRTGLRAATLTGMLVRLEAEGWIDRSQDPHDGRSTHLRATPRFEELRAAYATATEAAHLVAASFDAAQREAVADFLAQMLHAARTVSTSFELRD